MPRVRWQEVLRRLKQGEAAPVYYLYGEEVFLRDEAEAELVGRLLPAGASTLNREALAGDEADAAAIIGRAQMVPVLAPRRVILVRGADRLGARDLQALAAYLDAPVPTASLVFSAAKLDMRTRFAQALLRQAVVCRFERPQGEELRAWVRERLARRQRRIGDEALDLFLSLVGEELHHIDSELEKLALYLGDRAEAGPRDVEAVGGAGRFRTIFDLTEALGSRPPDAALAALRDLLEGGEEPLSILGMMARQYRMLIRARRALDGGIAEAGLASMVGIPPRHVPALARQARALSREALEAGLQALRGADLELKSGARGKGQGGILDRLVIALAHETPSVR